MTPEARAKLRELAMAATPGPWIVFNELPYRASLHEDVTGDKLGEIRRGRDLDANAAYIAAVHPGTIIEMLDALDAAEIKAMLADIYTPEEAGHWLMRGQALLGGRTPAAMIHEGLFSDVAAVVEQMNDGVYA